MTLHNYEPTHYFTTIGSHEPVLRIADGDTVETTTADAAGRAADGRRVTESGNPMTGPFYVEGAVPGDTLAITFDEMRPARGLGYARTVVAEHVVDAEFVHELPTQGEAEWHVDNTARTASVGHLAGLNTFSRRAYDGDEVPGAAELPAARGFSLPWAPMLGCFGVAPERGQAISTATSGPYGGNMDYRGFGAGITVYLPVSAPGALFFLGDGHVVQGDGEIVGTGIEAPFVVRFTVRVRHGWPINWPRAEDDRYLYTVGNARPLDQAVQHATTKMLRWLSADYGLDLRTASILLGMCVAYDLGNIYDPAYTMVCKVPKQVLAQLTA